MFRLAIILTLALPFSSIAWADDDWDEYYPDHYVEHVYVPERVVEYVPVERHYYAPPPPPVTYDYYDQRSTSGLVGGLVGSAMGYQMGQGDPIAAGLGAAAGSWFGNGMY